MTLLLESAFIDHILCGRLVLGSTCVISFDSFFSQDFIYLLESERKSTSGAGGKGKRELSRLSREPDAWLKPGTLGS